MILIIVLIYTLYYTYLFDRSMFLFIIIIILFGLWLSLFIGEKISVIEDEIKNVFTEQIDNVKNISSDFISEKLKKIKNNIFGKNRIDIF